LLYANDINDDGVIAGGSCVIVSGGCGSSVPAYMATPTGSLRSAGPHAVAKPVLPRSLLRLLRRRTMMP
jgi:hypothetical protein